MRLSEKMYEWEHDVINVSRFAIRSLDSLNLSNNPAIIFDIDNTLIDASNNCIKPIVLIYEYAVMIGVYPVIVTSRIATERVIQITKEQLSKIGIENRRMYFRKSLETNHWSFKRSARQNVEELGYNIVMSIGDSDWDITNGYTGIGIRVPINPVINNYFIR